MTYVSTRDVGRLKIFRWRNLIIFTHSGVCIFQLYKKILKHYLNQTLYSFSTFYTPCMLAGTRQADTFSKYNQLKQ